MNPYPQDVGTIIETAIDALKRGDTVIVTRLARHAASIAPDSEVAWLLLATVASREDSLAYVRNALEVNPQSEAAREALVWAQARLPASAVVKAQKIDQESLAPVVVPAQAVESEPQDTNIAPISHEVQLQAAQPAQPAQETEIAVDETIQPAQVSLSQELETSQLQPEPEPEPLLLRVEAPAPPAEQPKAFTTTSPPPVKQLPPSNPPASLKNSRKPPARPVKRSWLAPALTFSFSAMAVVGFAALIGLVFLQPQLTSVLAGFLPGNPCQASLVIGSQTYQVWPISSDASGNYSVPIRQPGRAYYVQDTSSNYVFFLSPVSDNQTLMSSLQAGKPASVTWSNCTTNSYRLGQPVPEILDMPDLLSQTSTGITVIVPWQGSSSGFVLKGMQDNFLLPVISTPDASLAVIPPEATAEVASPPVPVTGLSEFLTEISLLEITPSADLKTIQVGISIHNYGGLPGRLTVCDVALTPSGGTPLAAWLTDPALPVELAPGATQTLSLTFPHPATATATLNILNLEFVLEGY